MHDVTYLVMSIFLQVLYNPKKILTIIVVSHDAGIELNWDIIRQFVKRFVVKQFKNVS